MVQFADEADEADESPQKKSVYIEAVTRKVPFTEGQISTDPGPKGPKIVF